MTVPTEAKSHQTVWVDMPGRRTAAVRYVMDEDRIVCFGDEGLKSLADGARLTVALRGLACGSLESTFWVKVKDLDGDELSLALVSELVGDRSLGRTSDEVVRNLESMRSSRRLVALEG